MPWTRPRPAGAVPVSELLQHPPSSTRLPAPVDGIQACLYSLSDSIMEIQFSSSVTWKRPRVPITSGLVSTL